MAREQVAREEDQDQIRLVAPATLVDYADPIGVAVVSDADVGADVEHLPLEILDVALVLGVGQVIGEAPVRLTEELDDLAADTPQELGPIDSGDAVAGV